MSKVSISHALKIRLVHISSKSIVCYLRKASKGVIPSPSSSWHVETYSHCESSSSNTPATDVFGTRTPMPSPQSQSFSQGYGSILPTSLAYIVPLTRGFSPWKPDAVMSTTKHRQHSVL
ncbi:hypothetical protein PVK06_008300 [Gossypium arboreum]|uniref:Uncharacterized protein n=1 Tax=Gossypium arboreum TaxID=29729 RepID=A0ABR0QJS4_GOSAR|nr:hypothetical protein PVK06_008300 [Gossypium arboreum]